MHHMSYRLLKHVNRKRSALYCIQPPTKLRTCRVLAAANLEQTNGNFAHMRIRTQNNGKFLIFGTGNVILAGRKTHASACLSSLRMSALLSKHCDNSVALWPAVHSAPNSVVTGQLTSSISPSIKKSSIHTNSSSKFPGIALSVKEPGVTPELYLRRSMVIIPGVTSPQQLSNVVKDISAITSPYSEDSATEAQASACPGESGTSDLEDEALVEPGLS